MGPEAAIERDLISRVRNAGGMCVKLAPTVAGLPDRMVMLPYGRIYLVELKAPKGRLRSVQRVWHDRSARIGTPVVTLYTHEQVASWLESVT